MAYQTVTDAYEALQKELKLFPLMVECGACDGTGLYVGFAERDGSAVICSNCGGSGCREFKMPNLPKAFNGKLELKDVISVSRSGSGLVVAPGVDVNAITYQEFLEGKYPGEFELAPQYRKAK